MNLGIFTTKKSKAVLALFLVIAMCSLSGCGDNSNATKKQETKQETVQESSTHDVSKDKADIKKTISAGGYNLKNISISEQKDGSYQIIADMQLSQKDEATARSEAIKVIKEIFQANTGKDYDIEGIAITAVSNKAPIGIYQFTSAKYSVSGNDEYSAMINGKREAIK